MGSVVVELMLKARLESSLKMLLERLATVGGSSLWLYCYNNTIKDATGKKQQEPV